MKFNLVFFLIIPFLSVMSQSILIIDSIGDPISNVQFSNGSINEYSDFKGIVSLSKFTEYEEISVYHISYEGATIKKMDIKNGRITLKNKNYILETITISTPLIAKQDNQEIVKINRSEIIQSLSTNTAKLIEKQTPITIQKSQNGGGSPNIRGFEANRILLIVDGVKLNNMIYRSGHLQNILSVDMYAINDISFVNGPSSIFYGSGAIGGAIVMNTINPYEKKEKVFVQQYESSSSSISSHYHSTYSINNLSALSSVSIKKYGNLFMGKNRFHGYDNWGTYDFATDNNEQLFGEYSQIDLIQKFIFSVNSFSQIETNTQYSNTTKIDRFDKLNDVSDGMPKYNNWYYGPQKRFLQNLKFINSKTTFLYDNFNINFSIQEVEESRNQQRLSENYITKREELVKVYDARLELEKAIGKINLSYGGDARYETLNSKGYTENIIDNSLGYANSRYPDNGSTHYNFAFFILKKYQVLNKLSWENSVRMDYGKIEGSFSLNNPFMFEQDFLKNRHLNTSGCSKITLLFKKSTVSFSFFNAFRNPNMDDLGKVFSKNQGFVVVPNVNLNPEKIISTELAYTLMGENNEIIIKSYYNKLKDALAKRPISFNGFDSILYDGEMMLTIANVNITEANIMGIYLQFQRKLTDKLNSTFSLNYVNGKSSDSLPLSHIPPLSIKANLDYIHNTNFFSFYSKYNGWKRSENYDLNGVDNLDEATADGTPPWYTLNVMYKKSFGNLTFSLACENILDAHYKTFSSGISSSGRNFIVNLQSTF